MKSIIKSLFATSLILTLAACSGDESVQLNTSAESLDSATDTSETIDSNSTTTDVTEVESVEITTAEETTEEETACVAVSFENSLIPCRDLGDS